MSAAQGAIARITANATTNGEKPLSSAHAVATTTTASSPTASRTPGARHGGRGPREPGSATIR